MRASNRKPSQRELQTFRPWLPRIREVLHDLLTLPADWNGSRAAPINPELVRSAERLLTDNVPLGVPEPNVLPLPSGALGIEWHGGGIDLEIEVQEPEHFNVLFTDHRTEQEWDAESVLAKDPGLQSSLRLLADRTHLSTFS